MWQLYVREMIFYVKFRYHVLNKLTKRPDKYAKGSCFYYYVFQKCCVFLPKGKLNLDGPNLFSSQGLKYLTRLPKSVEIVFPYR